MAMNTSGTVIACHIQSKLEPQNLLSVPVDRDWQWCRLGKRPWRGGHVCWSCPRFFCFDGPQNQFFCFAVIKTCLWWKRPHIGFSPNNLQGMEQQEPQFTLALTKQEKSWTSRILSRLFQKLHCWGTSKCDWRKRRCYFKTDWISSEI